jgi:hypothetical protein
MKTKLTLIVTALLGGTVFAVAQTTHSGHGDSMDHATHSQGEPLQNTILIEPGQGAFAALSEVVRVLEADPETDRGQVDLAGLRAHLVDMDRLVSDTIVEETELLDGLSAVATGDADTLVTIRRMVPAHAAQLAQDDRWSVEAVDAENGVELRVTSSDPSVVSRIRGLGFFGLMASQDHHRKHHMMIARGEAAHVHYFKTGSEIIRLTVMMYVRFPLSLRNVENLLHERGIDISHETVRFWWHRFGPLFADEICNKRVGQMRVFKLAVAS